MLKRYKFPLEPAKLQNIEEAIRNYILPGYCPDTPFVPQSSSVLTAGSCFAEFIADALTRSGANATYLVTHSDNRRSPLSTLKMLQGNTDPALAQTFRAASMVVLTVGVALTPFIGNEPLIDIDRYAVNKITWRILSPEEGAAAIGGIVDIARGHNPLCHVVLTLSPIPLVSSTGHPSVFGQDCISKSSMRLAIEQVLLSGIPNISYWPSFEIVRWLGGHVGPFFGVEGEDNRHPARSIIDLITRLFLEKYMIAAK